MWDQGGQPWSQWPLSQQQWMQSFQHQQDPSQVDWAALAQAWIAQKETTGTEPQQNQNQPNGQEVPGIDPVPQGNHGAFPGNQSFGRMWQPEWGMQGQPPPPPPPPDQVWIPPGSGPMEVVNPSEDSNSQDSLEFSSEAHHGVYPQNSHGYGAQPDSYAMAPMAMNQFDYQHGAAPSFGPTPPGFHPPYWQGPPQNRRDNRPPGFRERPRSPIQLAVKQETAAALDAVKRRTLPAWIREGLEKMDREKQKKLERERMERERAEMVKEEKEKPEEAGDGPRVPRKSKFDSDDEGNKELVSRSPSPPREDSEPEMTEEERDLQLMVITKTLLTEILLEVTNEEIQQVARESHRKASKAPAKQLAQSSALASLTGLSGLGDYGSDESEDERSERASESSDTDEEELRCRIRDKQDAFHRKEREVQQATLERQALETSLARDEAAKERLSRERGEYGEGQSEVSHKQEAREAESSGERRRARRPSRSRSPRRRPDKPPERRRSGVEPRSGRRDKGERSASPPSRRGRRSRSRDREQEMARARESRDREKARARESRSRERERGERKRSRESSQGRSKPKKASGKDGESKGSKKGSAKTSKRHSDSDSSRSPTPESASQSTVDPEEVKRFQALASRWWDEGGEFAALHAMNDLRVPFIRDNLMSGLGECRPGSPLGGLNILDVGCGGGLLTEPLARLGAHVLGVDPVENSVGTARIHSSGDPELRDRVRYRPCTVEELLAGEEEEEKEGGGGGGLYDAVVASEVVEHLADLDTFAFCCGQLVKPGGSLFITTINKTRLSYALGIVAAEQVLRIVPPGTHDWEKFISPADLEALLQAHGFSVQSVRGMLYNPVTGSWCWSDNTDINYALHALKAADEAHREEQA
ncbi:hypothetical protein NHX12_001500 [Muraenolepis orangiensis]|uniref:Ubiquinone biosynthesis O-methyltransferase, mitochondrial n=1 Tax=Muraenolepis orangiensis TaxID=630683 RepID=A0A9Q0IH93_9TELE|nr:hypothetical protein NHX12_001500 [Muraenolepis orangiensis]